MKRLVPGLLFGLLLASLLVLGLMVWSSKPRPHYFDGTPPLNPQPAPERRPNVDLIDDR